MESMMKLYWTDAIRDSPEVIDALKYMGTTRRKRNRNTEKKIHAK
jgi:hypothetical protein